MIYGNVWPMTNSIRVCPNYYVLFQLQIQFINLCHFFSSPLPITCRALQSVPRRHTAFYNSTEFRVHELNKRLQQRTEVRILISF